MQSKTKRYTKITSIAVVLVMLLVSFGISANGGNLKHPNITSQKLQPVPFDLNPHAITGYVYWPNGTDEKTVSIPVTITNNRTSQKGIVYVDIAPGGNPDGTYQVDLANSAFYPSGYLSTDKIYVNCTYQNMWAKNQTTVGSLLAYSLCDLHLIAFPFGPKMITSVSGGTITGFDGAVNLTVPAGSLTADRVIYGTETTAAKFGSFDSINLDPKGLVFSSPATIRWSYAGIDLGLVRPETLSIYTSDNTPWVMLPSYVDTQTKEVIAQVNHFSNFSMGGAAAFGNQTGLLYTYQGTTNAPILDLTILNNDLVAADTLQYIQVVSNSTDNADIAGVSLWNDVNNDQAVGVTDVQIGGTLPVGAANFTGLSLVVPASSSLNLLIALNVAPAAVINHVLDLRIPVLGIGLANAGLSEATIDPSGNATINAELTDPHVVYGFVRNVLGPLPNVWVNLTNNRTLATENLTTDALGRYDMNLGFMNGGYVNGDRIFITANDTLGQTGWNITFVDVNNFGERCDVFVGKGPIASDETPANASVIFDVQRNITINITSTPISLDTSTIILEVNGTYFTIGSNLSFTGKTLTFNSFKAFGNWTDGQVVNVTLWQANDTAGNPCQNAPYTWWFMVSLTRNPAVGLWVEKDSANGNIAGDITLHWTDTNSGNMAYDIFVSNNKLIFNFEIPTYTTLPGESSWIHSGANNDGLNWFYIVRPVGGNVNSTMGFKIETTLQARAGYTRVNWVMLPWNTSYYGSAFALVREIEGGIGAGTNTIITAVARWNPYTQSIGIQASYAPGPMPPAGWRNDFIINPGDGIAIILRDKGMDWSYSWVINGTDIEDSVSLQARAGYTRVNWASLPVTGIYSSAFDVVRDLEGGIGAGTNTVITAVARWNPYTQSIGIQASYAPGPMPPAGWRNDFIINPGDGLAIILRDKGIDWTHVWTIKLLTPEV